MASRTNDEGDTELLRVDKDGFKIVYSCGVFEQCFPRRFSKDGKQIYIVTNKGDVDLSGLALLDPSTGETAHVESDPQKRVDFGSVRFSEKTDELLRKELPGKEIGIGRCTFDERLCLVSARSDREPGEYYLFNRKTKERTLQYRRRDKIPREALSAMESIQYRSSDGLEIPAYLTLPHGVERQRSPLSPLPT